MLERFDHLIEALGPWALWAFGAAAVIEYLFPPFPGDTIALVGGVWAARGQRPWWPVLASVILGSVIGLSMDYYAGLKLAGPLERHSNQKRFLGLNSERLRHLQEQMRTQGVWLLAINRFLPGIRALIFLAAGAARMDAKKVIGLGALSAALYNALLVLAGVLVGGNAEKLERLVHRSQVTFYSVLAVVVVGLVARWLVVRHRLDKPTPP